jgi:hypothetical protein
MEFCWCLAMEITNGVAEKENTNVSTNLQWNRKEQFPMVFFWL